MAERTGLAQQRRPHEPRRPTPPPHHRVPFGPRRPPPEPPAEPPVFHDGTGRRRQWVTLLFVSVGVALVATLGTLTLALTGTSPVPLPGFPDATRNANRDPGVITPAPRPTSAPGAGQPGQATTTGTTTSTTAAATTTKPGHVPTQTPSHNPRPTKTK